MDVFSQFLEARDAPIDWRPVALPAAERLQRFDRWLRAKLAERLDWSWAGDEAAQARRREQARVYLERLVLGLWRRGWLLDGSKLAARILDPLDKIAKYQKDGAIHEFWPYFCATVDRYVGANSEEIQDEARRVGSTIGQIVGQLGLNKPQNAATLPELLARRASEVEDTRNVSLREKQAALRRKEAEKAELERQPRLF